MAAVNKTSEPVAMANSSKTKQIVKEERDLIEVVNNLQNKLIASGHSIEISLPQIVVVGCQSAGKSSVLENIVGKEFLPRGTGVVTRRPIVVQLNPCSEEYAVFLHKPTEIFKDFMEVRNEIQRITSEATGKNSFSSKPIHLQIYSPSVLKLTLVDLPGLVKIPLGDQPDNIVAEVHDMVVEYISQPKSLILAVSPANQDLANSDALNIAKMVDKNRERTIGVLTKLDLMDQGTDARDVLENKVLSLKRGYVGVINRSQKDIEDKKDISYALQKERDFFRNHHAYRHLANRMGTLYLRQLLQKQLQAHIKEYLGEVRKELSDSYTKNKKKLDNLNGRLGRGGDNKQVLMLRLVQQFVDSMKMKFLGQSEHVDLSVVSPGAHINYLMYTKIQQNLNVELIPDQKELTTAIANILGLRTAIAVPTLAFDVMCRRLIEKYKEPIQQCVSVISKIVIQAVEESATEISGYPSLRSELIYRVSACVKNQEEITKEVLLNHVEAEMYCVNIGHPDFESSILNHIAPPTGPVKIWEEELSQPEDACDHSNAPETDDQEIPQILLNKLLINEATQKKVIYVTGLIGKYLEVVRKTMGDIVIKYILFFLVKHVLDFVSFNLSADLSSLGNIDSLMQECEEDIQKQAELEFTCETIQSALEAIQSF